MAIFLFTPTTIFLKEDIFNIFFLTQFLRGAKNEGYTKSVRLLKLNGELGEPGSYSGHYLVRCIKILLRPSNTGNVELKRKSIFIRISLKTPGQEAVGCC